MVAERCSGGEPDGQPVLALGVLGDAVAHLPGEVQAPPVALEHVDDAQALLVVIEPAGDELVQDALAGVPERRVTEIVTERNRLGQLFVQPQHLGDGPRDLGHLQRVREARAIVIARGREEDLGLVLQPSERLAVDDAIPIALEAGANRILGLGSLAAARIAALRRLGRQRLPLAGLELFTNGHRRP